MALSQFYGLYSVKTTRNGTVRRSELLLGPEDAATDTPPNFSKTSTFRDSMNLVWSDTFYVG